MVTSAVADLRDDDADLKEAGKTFAQMIHMTVSAQMPEDRDCIVGVYTDRTEFETDLVSFNSPDVPGTMVQWDKCTGRAIGVIHVAYIEQSDVMVPGDAGMMH